MRQYIFLTAEGSTYQPDSVSSVPDIENLQVIGFAQGKTAKEATRNLIKSNECLADTKFNEIFSIELSNNNREFFLLQDLIGKSSPKF